MDKKISKISSYAIDLLNKYDFPGNVRELENLMERSVALSNTNILLPDSLALSLHKRSWDKRTHGDTVPVVNLLEDEEFSLDEALAAVEKHYIEQALEICQWDRGQTAELLDINPRSLRYRIDKLGIRK